MKKQLGTFRLLEQIDPGGYTIVYRAEQDLGQGFTRPAAVKILQGVDLDDEEKAAVLRREVEALVELSSCPNIVTIYGLGIDEEVGPWIAMELAGRSLKHFIGDKPAEPDQVRIVLRDTLRALAVVHGATPPILHRDLKPNNILSTDYGVWQITDFGLARRWEADDTLHLATVQYAAPELLDTTLGPESPRMDLYSLGMTAYQLALGRELYRRQFPSVYDPYGGKDKGDERPKWMYWHTSAQMGVPSVGELIEDYPTDLSDLIAAMMVKPLAERIGTAGEALARLGDVEGSLALPVEPQEAGPEIVLPQRWRTPALAALVVVVIVLFAATYFWVRSGAGPKVQLADRYTGTAPILVNGVVERFPRRGSATVELPNGSSFPVYVDDEGNFTSEVLVPELGETRGMLKVLDRAGRQVGLKSLTMERIPPETVQVVLATRPAVPRADVVITQHNRPDEPLRLRTDQSGVAQAELAYGTFDMEVAHPRYRPLADSFSTGIDPQKPTIFARLAEIPLYEIYEEMRNKIDRIKRLASRKANCPPGPLSETESEQLESSLNRLRQLAEGDPDIGLFIDAVERVEECNPESFAAVEAAAARAQEAVAAKEAALPEDDRAPGAAPREPRGGDVAAGGRGGPGGAGSFLGGGGGPGGVPAAGGSLGTQQVNELIRQIMEQGGAVVDPVVQAALMRMPLGEFRDFVEANVPTGALVVEAVEHLNVVRLRGALFDVRELERLVLRLLAAMPRIQPELRIDAWALCRDLEKRLEAVGAEGVRVHAYLATGDHTMFVQFTRTDELDVDAVSSIAHEFVIDEHLARVQGFLAERED